MMKMTLQVSGLKEMEDRLAKAPSMVIEPAIKAALTRTAEAMAKKMKQNLQNVGGRTFGHLFSSIWFEVTLGAMGTYIASIGPGLKNTGRSNTYGDPANYGYFVEFGRRPGGAPPADAIRIWSQEKLGRSDPALVWAIQRKIATHGVKARPFVRPLLQQQNEINQVYQRALQLEITKRLGT